MNTALVHNQISGAHSRFRGLNRICGEIVRSIRINSLDYGQNGGRPVYIKRRNPFGRRILSAANWFFRISRAPISFWTQTSDWQRWEVDSFSMLNPGYEASCLGADAIVEEALPGEPLWLIAKRGELKPGMLDAAGIELRRAHTFRSGWFAGPWSHGDGAMCNVIYDMHTMRARLIDFELIHDRLLGPGERHAQDLLSFLLDLVGVVGEEEWLPYALRYLHAYGNGRAVRRLYDVLPPPGGVARFWWKIRGNFADEKKIVPRLDELRRALMDSSSTPRLVRVNAAAGGESRRHRHRARRRRWLPQF
jgi:hypothetical protein